jgi:hypothetical protein
MTAIKRLQPVSIYMSPLILRECIACKYSAQVPLLKITSLRQIQIAQRSAQTPTCIHAFVSFINVIQPITKQVLYIYWRRNIKGEVDNLPN